MPPADEGPTVMAALRVMSFNLRRDVEHDGDNRWLARRDAVADVVRQHQPDILGTQEGLPHQLADLDARLPGYARLGSCRQGDNTDEACAIYYDRSRLRPLAWGDLWLSDTPGVAGSRSWGNRHPRLVTWAQFLDGATGQSFAVANTHLDHESERARQEAARFLASRLPGALLMGDFNAEPGGDAHRILTQAGWCDAFVAHDDPSDPGYTFHGYSGRAWARLDWILAPPSHRVRAHRIVRHPARHVSDHHPVLAEIERAA